jgi:hypothetical protein
MEPMFTVPLAAMPHVIVAAEVELARLVAVERAVGDDWPADFDRNDIPMFMIALKELRLANSTQTEEVFLSGKILWFLLDTLPDYVRANNNTLSSQEYAALKRVYAQQVPARAKRFPFPER